MPREDRKNRRRSTTSSSSISRTASQERALAQSSSAPITVTPSIADDVHLGSYSVLTGQIDRPLAKEPDWILDLQLMHHYMANTKLVMSEHSDLEQLLRIWQEEMPKTAFKHEYVMHGLLGFSALHKAQQGPEQAALLRTSAVDHLDKALMLYRQNIGQANAENADARFLFTWLVALFGFAIPPSVPPIDAIIEIFLLVKGIDIVLAETWFWVSQGPFAPILSLGVQNAFVLPVVG